MQRSAAPKRKGQDLLTFSAFVPLATPRQSVTRLHAGPGPERCRPFHICRKLRDMPGVAPWLETQRDGTAPW